MLGIIQFYAVPSIIIYYFPPSIPFNTHLFLFPSFSDEQAQLLAATVSKDKEHFSISFNEFLQFMANQNASEPDEETLVDMFK